MAELTSQSRRVVFVDDEYRQQNPKKRHAERACDDCRRKKKRCAHQPDLSGSPTSQGVDNDSERVRTSPLQQPKAAGVSGDGGGISSGRKDEGSPTNRRSYQRFIGDLNPERELRSPQHGRESVGVWHSEDADASDLPTRSSASSGLPPSNLFHHCSQLTRRLLLPIMDDQFQSFRPPEHHLRAMEQFYFDNVHPILPAVDEAIYRGSPTTSPLHVLQSQALCLAVHTNPAVREHLFLNPHHNLLTPEEFARTLLGSMRLHIELALTTDKAVLIRTLATMSLFGYTRDALELTCQFFVRAVHLSFTVGLHLDRTQDRDDPALDGLFCYVWAIDRLHAAMQGRPVIMQQHDMPVTPMHRAKGQPAGLRVFVRLATLLDRVIDLYRPTSSELEIPAADFPSYEDVLSECEALDMSIQCMVPLELLYHAVTILSCRSRKDLAKPGGLVPSARQNLSAAQIVAILEEEVPGSNRLPLLPYVPYAVSLSVSTCYRQIRHTRVLSFKIRSRKLVLQNLRHLKNMSEYYWSAAVMAELARKSLVETRSLGWGESREGVTDGTVSLSAARQDLLGRDQSRRQSYSGPGYANGDDQQLDNNWHSTSMLDIDSMLASQDFASQFEDLDGLLDANLELNMPTFFPEMDTSNFWDM